MSRRVIAAICCATMFISFNLHAACDQGAPGYFSNRFIVNPDGTVTDKRTGLVWMRCDLGEQWNATTQTCEIPLCDSGTRWDPYNEACQTTQCPNEATWNPYKNVCESPKTDRVRSDWGTLLQAASAFNQRGFAGRTDWRVPNLKEMASIIVLACFPSIDTEAFPEPESQYWTSTPSTPMPVSPTRGHNRNSRPPRVST